MTLTIFPELEQGSPEWIAARAGLVTASTVGKLLTTTGRVADNDTSRGLVEQLTIERLTGRVDLIHPTFDMRRGTALEPFARDEYVKHHAPVAEVGFGRVDVGPFPFGASPDGLVDELGGIEIKCPRPRAHFRTILADKVPAIYLPQIHMNMLVFDADWWDFVSYVPGMALFVKRVQRDEEWDERIANAVKRAEEDIRLLTQAYEDATKGKPDTDYHDPLADTEEEIE